MTERMALQDVVKAWEALPEGNYGAHYVEKWLREHMKPAIDKARAVLVVGEKEDK